MPGKKGLLIAIPVLLVLGGGGFYGAAVTGLLKVPGITPKAKLSAAKMYGEGANKMYGEGKDSKVASVKPRPKAKPKPTPKPRPTHLDDPVKGAAAVAEVWNGMEPAQLIKIVADWSDSDLALVMAGMDTTKASELLAGLPPKRASNVSRAIEAYASKVPIKD